MPETSDTAGLNLEMVREANKLHAAYAEIRLKYFAWFATFNAVLFYFYLQTQHPVVSGVVALAGLFISTTLEVLDYRASQVVALAVASAQRAETHLGLENAFNTSLHNRSRAARRYRFLIMVLILAPLVGWFVAFVFAVLGTGGAGCRDSFTFSRRNVIYDH